MFKELSAQLDALHAKLNALVESDLAQLNKLLVDRKLDPIRAGGKAGAADNNQGIK